MFGEQVSKVAANQVGVEARLVQVHSDAFVQIDAVPNATTGWR
jgi:hypothetical protein